MPKASPSSPPTSEDLQFGIEIELLVKPKGLMLQRLNQTTFGKAGHTRLHSWSRKTDHNEVLNSTAIMLTEHKVPTFCENGTKTSDYKH
jgi:hypothetical protein